MCISSSQEAVNKSRLTLVKKFESTCVFNSVDLHCIVALCKKTTNKWILIVNKINKLFKKIK